jgi:hypothetical protein
VPVPIDDLCLGHILEPGVETVPTAGQDVDLDPAPAQFQGGDQPRRTGADHDDRTGNAALRGEIGQDHRQGTADAALPDMLACRSRE